MSNSIVLFFTCSTELYPKPKSDSLQYAAVNDSLIKYAGSTGFANFIGNLHANEVYNANFANHLNLRLDSSSIKMDSFLRAQNPINLINLNSGYFANLVSSYNSYDFLRGVANGGGIDFNTLLMNLCQCMEVNSSTVGYSLFGWFTLNTDNLQELAAAMYIYNSTDLNNLMASIGYGGSGTLEDMQDFISNLTDLSTITSQLSLLGYENCDQLRNCLYSRFRSDPNACILSLSNINSLKQLIAGADYSSCTQPGSQLVVNALFSHKPQIFWDNLIANENDTDMVIWYKQNELQNYYYTLALYNKYWISDYQRSNNMYSSTGTGMEAYFTRVKNHFGQSFYDNLLSKFMNASKTYVDSFRLSEQHIYGSARLGIYNQYVPLAYRYFNATASGNELNAQVDISISISTISYSLFSIERGKKSYELSNHLGNVLTVISDKRVITCQSDTIAYYSAEIISATDYSPFGAPLPGRTFSGDGYRFRFNGQEQDNEVSGTGNIMTAEFWMYDGRLGRRFNRDPEIKMFESPYATFANNPISFIDVNGADTITLSKSSWTQSQRCDCDPHSGSSYTSTVKGAPGPNVFYYEESHKNYNANGGIESSSYSKRQFYPLQGGKSGVTETPYFFGMLSYEDHDQLTLARLASPEIMDYLIATSNNSSEANIYRSVKALQSTYQVFVGLKNAYEAAYAIEGGFGLLNGLFTRGTNAGNVIGILRDASMGKGDFGLGLATYEDAMVAGEAWVGKGYTVSSGGTWVSKDGLRQFRPPSYKPKLQLSQANFEWRNVAHKGQWQANGHLVISNR